ncbi:hypothetical protein QWZ16_21010 [Vibrio ostreicida]|uniref:Transposase n=1 Tax=Vibrio ostreicida TaxID=526588 RepID=A0ABT8BY26_9VIBR|nr:hypothetical protein [Vibrio ostreicida]MDN3612077.1 hypothetical protein [Vibrio ostreicida]
MLSNLQFSRQFGRHLSVGHTSIKNTAREYRCKSKVIGAKISLIRVHL